MKVEKLKYCIWGRISKVYYCYTDCEQNAEIFLKDAKKLYPNEDWEIIREQA